MDKNFSQFSARDAQRVANTATGKTLAQLLQREHQQSMQTMLTSAQNGDTQQLQKTIAALMADPKMAALIRQLQEEAHE